MFSAEIFQLWSTSLSALPRVWGYLDPGSGSLLLQIMLAGMLSSLFFVKTWFRRLREYLPVKSDKA